MSKQLLPSASALLLAGLLATACGGSEATTPAGAADAQVAVPATGLQVSGVHPVRCGCAIESVGHCGNYVEVDGAFLPLTGELGLGPMEFCGREGLRASVTGEVVDGKLVATAFELVD